MIENDSLVIPKRLLNVHDVSCSVPYQQATLSDLLLGELTLHNTSTYVSL